MRRPETLIAASVLLILLIILGVLYGRDLLAPPAPAPTLELTNTPTPPPPSAPAPPLPSAPASLPAAQPTTPTPEPGGQVMTLAPGAGEVVWWGSGQNGRANAGDSYLYAGYFEAQAFVSLVSFNTARLPRGAPIREATLYLTGLRADRLDPGTAGQWSIQLLAVEALPDLARSDFQSVFNAPAAVTLFPALVPGDLGENRVNQLSLDQTALAWLDRQILDNTGAVLVRLVGPTAGADSLFAWDSGAGPQSPGNGPRLVISLGPQPPTPPPLPTQAILIATLTATPANVLTVAAQAETATAVATTLGTYTPTPNNVVTPTPFPANLETVQAIAFAQSLPPVILHTPVPANAATASADAAYATAVALTTGTFTPVPDTYVTPQLILPSPPAQNVATAAARVWTATAQAQERAATPTPLPYNAVIAQYVVATPTPANLETVQARSVNATAVALTTGTPAPLAWNAVVIQPAPEDAAAATPTALIVYLDQLTPTPTAPATLTPPDTIPADLVGQILFVSNREGATRLYSLNPTSGRIAQITQSWPYELAKQGEAVSPGGGLRAIVQEDDRRVPQVYVYDPQYDVARNLSQTTGWSYDPAWSPLGDRVAFVSQEPGNDEIYTVNPDGSNKQRLTQNTWEWDKHPTWSPDGSQIVFYSNRDVGRRQLWIMDADGANQRRLLESAGEDWDPVWVKRP